MTFSLRDQLAWPTDRLGDEMRSDSVKFDRRLIVGEGRCPLIDGPRNT